jgi:hypothetical protein
VNHVKADWRILRGSLGVFAMCVVLAFAVLTASNLFWRKMQAEYQTHYTRFREVSTKYLAVDNEERIIVEQYPKFVALYNRGVIGDEHRLSWVEALKTAGTELGIPQVEYTIDSQTLYTSQVPLNTGPFDVNTSVMELTLGLVHEGDLERLLQHLDSAAEGLFTVEACELIRQAAPTVTAHSAPANLRAACKLRWFTVDRAGDEGVKL